jgi:hypothetical protein
MKMFDAAKFRNIAEELTSKAMMAAMVTLSIRFFMVYMAASLWFYTISVMPFFNCIYARKRIVNRIAHRRKFALFPGGSKYYCPNEDLNL